MFFSFCSSKVDEVYRYVVGGVEVGVDEVIKFYSFCEKDFMFV